MHPSPFILRVEVIYFWHEQTGIAREGSPKHHPRNRPPWPRRQPNARGRQGPAVVPQANRALPAGAELHAHQNLKYKRRDHGDHDSARRLGMITQKEENGNFQEQLTDLKKEKSVLSQMIVASFKRAEGLNEEVGHY